MRPTPGRAVITGSPGFGLNEASRGGVFWGGRPAAGRPFPHRVGRGIGFGVSLMFSLIALGWNDGPWEGRRPTAQGKQAPASAHAGRSPSGPDPEWRGRSSASEKLAAGPTPMLGPLRPAIEIRAGQWWVRVGERGDALGGYGSGLGVGFPPGTFDPRAIEAGLRPHLSQLRLGSGPQTGGPFGVQFFHGAVRESLYATVPGPITEAFEPFRRACRQRKAANGEREFADSWREHPPTPASKPWDEDGRCLVVRVRVGLWSAEANEDGSGSIARIGLGDGAVTAELPPRSLDTPSIARRLRPSLAATPPAAPPARGPMEADFFRDGRRQTLFATGPAPLADAFEAFRAACRQGKCSAPGRVEAAWKKNPPTPASKPWDAP